MKKSFIARASFALVYYFLERKITIEEYSNIPDQRSRGVNLGLVLHTNFL